MVPSFGTVDGWSSCAGSSLKPTAWSSSSGENSPCKCVVPSCEWLTCRWRSSRKRSLDLARNGGRNFAPSSRYRIGLGIPGDVTPDVTLELHENETAVSKEPVDFIQKNTNHWWGVPQIAARGFALSASELAGEGKELVFRMSIPRESAEKAGKLYIFISRDYGANTWYLEDGSELDESNW